MSARNVARPIVLDPDQRAQLQSLSTAPYFAACCGDYGSSDSHGGRRSAEYCHRRARRTESTFHQQWRRRFAEHGVEGLHDELRPGRPRTIEDDRIAKLINQTLQSKPKNATHWTTRLRRNTLRSPNQRCSESGTFLDSGLICLDHPTNHSSWLIPQH
jgi:hypothetical protein